MLANIEKIVAERNAIVDNFGIKLMITKGKNRKESYCCLTCILFHGIINPVTTIGRKQVTCEYQQCNEVKKNL